MKKFIYTMLIFSLFAGLIGGCANNNSNKGSNAANGENTFIQTNGTLNQEIADLQSELDAAETTISSQKEYISELTQQLAECQTLISDSDSDPDQSDDSDYTQKYPQLYAEKAYENKGLESEKIVYLTFDDGPSNRTLQILDLLDQYQVKATFFVVYRDEDKYKDYLSEIIARGHTLALHSYSHDYNKIYASVDDFLEDFEKVYNWVYEETGQRPTLYRFPGGSTKGDRAVTDNIIAEMERRGFIYYDWNVSSGDGSDLTPLESIIDNICDNVNHFETPVVLMHDAIGKQATFEALPTILQNLKNMGYSFESLNEEMKPIQFLRKQESE